MDKKERIEKIAKALTNLHVTESWDEAVKRATAIVESQSNEGKPLNELFEDVQRTSKELGQVAKHLNKENMGEADALLKEASAEQDAINSNLESAKEDKAETADVKEDAKADVKAHRLEKDSVEAAMDKVEAAEHAAEDAEFIVEEAERIQKEKEHKE